MVSIFGSKNEKKVNENNFRDQILDEQFIINLLKVKQAAALANKDSKAIEKSYGEAIAKACEELILEIKVHKIPLGMLQGGAYTKLNIFISEFIAKRADKVLAKLSGKPKKLTSEGVDENIQKLISALNHVNKSQSTNDVIPTSLKITLNNLGEELESTILKVRESLDKKAKEFSTINKAGRTHLQDAVSITLGQEFQAYSALTRRSRERIINANKEFLKINLGGTAIGTSINASDKYKTTVIKHLRRITGKNLQSADNLIDNTQNTDCYLNYSASLSILASNLIKFCNDIRLMLSGPNNGFGELKLKNDERGSSIMPGKRNPMVIEYCEQAAIMTRAYDEAVKLSSEAGNFELNVFLPVIAKSLINSSKLLINALSELSLTIKLLEADKDKCEIYYKHSLDKVTEQAKSEGYEKAEETIEEQAENKK